MAEEISRLEAMRHSCAHVMAQAVGEMFPGTRFGIGPNIEDGFYYDFDLPRPLKPENLPEIEKRMAAIVSRNLPIVREEIDKERAKAMFAQQPYKLELIDELAEQSLSIYRQEGFVDLCRGPHVKSTGEVGPFKLLSIAGAYWRGNEKRPMLQRLYATAFLRREDLEAHLARLEEAEKRDHRRLGRELDLFSIHEDIGPGLVLWHPKGAALRRTIEDFWKDEHARRGYELVYTPHIARVDMWKVSGHWDLYREYLYSPMDIEGQAYILKPMNCPFHITIYKSRRHSYRELPVRLAELGTVYRYERTGVLHGLARVRGFTQDDAHIFCRPDQLEAEVADVLELAAFMLTSFGFKEYEMRLSTRPEKYAGTSEMWEESTATLRRALEKLSLPYGIDPGEGVFYGPKIDIKLKDALGRAWQGPTIQVDFNNPQRFDVNYDGEDGKAHPVVMVHRTVLGSMERFMACLIEHYRGAFPVWLAPVQAVLIPIADRHLGYAQEVEKALRQAGLRVRLDSRPERMQHKIREAQLEKVPYMLVMGDKEAETHTVALRLRDGQDKGAIGVSQFEALARQAIEERQ